MAREQQRVVAELGRPETPDETAARKAESSRIYRSSQNVRNLVAALIATVAVVLVIVVAVPRGTAPERAAIDVASIAEGISAAEDHTLVVPKVPSGWIVNSAELEDDAPATWDIVYVPAEEGGFLHVAQGFDADPAWPTRVLAGAAVKDTVTIDGIVWSRYEIRDSSAAGNITAALSTDAGTDTVMVYGATTDRYLQQAAAAVSDDIRTLREAGK